LTALGRCAHPVSDLHAGPDADTECVSECLFGERVELLERAGDWCRVRNRRDDYRGWLRAEALEPVPAQAVEAVDATRGAVTAPHVVGVRATLLFAAADLKSPVRLRVTLGAELTLADERDGDEHADRTDEESGGRIGERRAIVDPRFARVRDFPGGGEAWAWRAHCLPPGATLGGTAVDTARRLYEGAPYRWGGRTPDGADCSGLVQGTAFALGLGLPRDSGDQERALRHVLPFARRDASDLVFWPGHVGLLVDPDTLFHATAHTLATALEPLADVVRRAGLPSSVRRLPSPGEALVT